MGVQRIGIRGEQHLTADDDEVRGLGGVRTGQEVDETMRSGRRAVGDPELGSIVGHFAAGEEQPAAGQGDREAVLELRLTAENVCDSMYFLGSSGHVTWSHRSFSAGVSSTEF